MPNWTSETLQSWHKGELKFALPINSYNFPSSLYFPDTTAEEQSQWKLLELDPHILKEFEEGKTVQIKGGLHEKVVLCSDTKTYELKEAEISNSLVLVPGLKFAQQTTVSPLKVSKNNINRSLDTSNEEEAHTENERPKELEHIEVLKIFNEYFELRPIKPRFRKLYDLLQLTRYSGPENETDENIDPRFLFTWRQLLDTTQCSDAEFQSGLNMMRAITIGEHIRMLSVEYEHRVVSLMLDLIDENSWKLDEIDRTVAVESLKGIVPEEVVGGLFTVYTEEVPEKPGKFKFNEEYVCQAVARHILQPGMRFHREDFMTTWQEDLPAEIRVKEEYLKGIGIIDNFAKPVSVISLNEFVLPTGLHERIKTLFTAKAQWTVEEITPFLATFLTGQQTVAAILMKFTRAMKLPDGSRVYLEKYGK